MCNVYAAERLLVYALLTYVVRADLLVFFYLVDFVRLRVSSKFIERNECKKANARFMFGEMISCKHTRLTSDFVIYFLHFFFAGLVCSFIFEHFAFHVRKVFDSTPNDVQFKSDA